MELQKHAASFVNLSRIQLALRGLRQEAGKESVRVALLGLAKGSAGRTAKEVLRLVLADPLKPEEDWERQLRSYDTAQPVIIRVGPENTQQQQQHHTFEYAKSSLLPEVDVASATLNGNNIEILVTEFNPLDASTHGEGLSALDEAVLVPTVDIPTSDSGRYTPITTPVHKALVIADGIIGAAIVASTPSLHDKDEIATAVNLKTHEDDIAGCPFIAIDVDSGSRAVAVFREGVEHAMEYQSLWSKSNLPSLVEWLRLGALNTPDGSTKPAVRTLIASILRDTLSEIQAREAVQLAGALRSEMSTTRFVPLNKGLAEWAADAHAELQEELDIAFTGRRWRQLGWWKLFWRADDVSMLASEMVTRRFLPNAEQEVIYLAGRIDEAISPAIPEPAQYTLPAVTPSSTGAAGRHPSSRIAAGTKWPTNIPFTRGYLLSETVPALQALAQKLVLQTLGTSAMTTSLAALMYLSSFGASEAGAVGALGLVWSLGRMQKKWEAARGFWEGEVREEGRKAVRAVEASVASVLDQDRCGEDDTTLHDLRQARVLVQRAEDALEKLQ